ncbi:MAG: sensor histidine kinase [Cellulosilyticaceae bacterium]
MKIGTYFKERMGFLIINITMLSIVLITMGILKISIEISMVVFFIWFMPLISYMFLEFIKYKKYYAVVEETYKNIELKYLLAEVIEQPSFAEGKMFYEILKSTNKEMHEEINRYKMMQQDYKEYIESWIHEIKTPIAAINLMIENNKLPITDKIQSEMEQVESYIEQALYYARSNDVSKDYIIKPFKLKKIVMEVIQNNSRTLIQKGIMPQLGNLDEVVYSDSKWVTFILNQIISNSIKYNKASRGIIKIDATKENYCVVLTIEDNGIGIQERDLGRVFDKGFTGENGRKFVKSTGIGLYLCKKLCNRLGMGLELTSKLGEGTMVKLIFPVGDLQHVKIESSV